jgi:protein-disulfide isomerase
MKVFAGRRPRPGGWPARALLLTASLGLSFGCGGEEPPAATSPATSDSGSAATGAGRITPTGPTGDWASEAAEAGASGGDAAGASAVPVPDMLALENQPGATPALPQVEVPPGPAHPSLAGAPGPSPGMGPGTAAVKIFVFSDFQCPVCRRIVEPLKQIVRDYPGAVQVIFKHHALGTHSRARDAAAASIAAYRQGKFWEYHDEIFERQGALDPADLVGYAQALGLDTDRFKDDMAAADVAAQIDYETEMAQKLGAEGTPGLFINGMFLPGWGSYPGFKAMVEEALRDARGRAAGGSDDIARAATVAAGDEGRLLAELMWGASD